MGTGKRQSHKKPCNIDENAKKQKPEMLLRQRIAWYYTFFCVVVSYGLLCGYYTGFCVIYTAFCVGLQSVGLK